MSEKNEDEFQKIIEGNNLEEEFAKNRNELTIKDIQNGLADACQMTSFLSAFLVDFFTAFEHGDLENTPRLSSEIIIHIKAIFNDINGLLELIDIELEDED